MLNLLLVLGAIYCAIQAIRVTRLLPSALWLAGVSALVSLIMYLMGAYQVAVIELSVGAGLVTVLFVFAINIASEEQTPAKSLVPLPLAIGLAGVTLVLLGWFVLPLTGLNLPVAGVPFTAMFWEQRGMDVLVQIVLIFAVVLGVLGLLVETTLPAKLGYVNGKQAADVSSDPHAQIAPYSEIKEEVRV